MNCSNCGHENKDSAKFCTKCGALLAEVPKKKSNSSKYIIIALIVIILLLGSAIGYFIMSNGLSSQSSGNDGINPSVQSGDNVESSDDNDVQVTSVSQTTQSTKSWELIGSYSGSGSGSQVVSVPEGQIMIKISAYPIKNYATNHLYVTGSNGESAGVDWGSASAVASKSDSLSYTSSSSQTFTIEYYETVSWNVDFYRYQ